MSAITLPKTRDGTASTTTSASSKPASAADPAVIPERSTLVA
jgi:hypothetical protein